MIADTGLLGKTYGRWTVIGGPVQDARGQSKWLCRCSCGTQRYVLQRSLVYGGSISCGCLRRERARQTRAYDLKNQTFGDLCALHPAEHQPKNGGVWWTCRCTCGALCDVPASRLITGRKTHCGCKSHPQYAYADITGQRFHALTALYRIKNPSGDSVWHCRCDCGNEVDIPYNELVYTNRQSCGCRKKAHDAQLSALLTHVDGTSIDMLRSSRIPRNNTTGVKGVYLIRGKYAAKIVFQKKQYFLGAYDSLKKAAEVRKEAEKTIAEGTVRHYERWKQRADQDPEWALENPIRICAEKTGTGEVSIAFLPQFSDE